MSAPSPVDLSFLEPSTPSEGEGKDAPIVASTVDVALSETASATLDAVLVPLEETAKKATPGPWHPGCFVADNTPCQCKYVLAESYMGSIATISVNNDLAVGDGGNDSPPVDEAKANLRFIASANPSAILSLRPAIEAAIASAVSGAEKERNALIKAVGVHATVRSEYFARAEAAESERDALKADVARLREALTLTRGYVAEQMIANAIVLPPLGSDDHKTTLLMVIDAALKTGGEA